VQVTGVSPAAGPPSGGTVVTVTGSGFATATAPTSPSPPVTVNFGANAGTGLFVQSDTQLTVTSPPGAGTVDVTVVTPTGSSTPVASDKFAYEPTPQLYLRVWQALAAAEPQSQPPSAGAQAPATFVFSLEGTGVTVTLTSGNGYFHPGDFWRFALRPIEPAIVYPARYLIAGQPPEGPRTWFCPLAQLTWSNGVASVESLVPQFWNLVTLTNTMAGQPVASTTVTSIVPTTGPPSGGTQVTLTGTGLLGATAVNFGSVAVTPVVSSNTQLTVVSPPGTGPVAVVVEPGGISAPSQFTYLGVTGVSPASGPAAGATKVTVTGTGFLNATAVNFGSVAGTIQGTPTETSITVMSPAATQPGAVDLTVVTPLGTTATQAADRFTYYEVTGISLANGTGGPVPSVTGGTVISINGGGLSTLGKVTGVGFGGNAVVSPTSASDTAITATCPTSYTFSGTVSNFAGTTVVTIIAAQGTVAAGSVKYPPRTGD